MADRNVTLRRHLEQVEHCIAEARSVLASNEDPRCAKDDVLQAQSLIADVVLPALTKLTQNR